MRTISLVLFLWALLVGAGTASAAESPGFYVGLGLRGLARDPTSAALVVKIEFLDTTFFENHRASLSVRPKVLVGGYLEARLPLVLELAVTPRVFPFAGIGAAYNTDDFGHLDHMYTFGSDFTLRQRLTASVTCNLIYQDRVSDRDTEIIVTFNLEF